ncbi:MAG TPA: SpoIIE family protein phosphatase [bacterium]|nr:SpoIIE family protein phosphatase [bacterium]HNJ71038.1 SpoIIE family protein phosphatase [bacterium]
MSMEPMDKPLDKQSLIKGEVQDDVDRKLLELSALFEISQLLNSSLNLTSIVDNILLSPMGRMMINKGLFLLHRGDHQYEIFTLKGLSRDLIGKKISITEIPQKSFLLDEVSDAPYPWLSFFTQYDMKLIVPIVLRNDLLGLVAFGKKLIGGPYIESEIEFLSSIANIAATSIQNGIVFEELRSVNARLDKKIQELHTLFDIGKELNATLDAQKVVKLLSYGLMGEMMVNRFAILVRRHDGVEYAEKRGLARLQLDDTQTSLVFNYSQPAVVTDDEHSELQHALQNQDIIAIVPMRSQDRTKGVLLLGPKISGKGFTKEELDFVFTLGNQAMISLENAWLFEDSLERKRLEEELELARKIQMGLLPKDFPKLNNFEVYGLNISSKQVGGDYFDVLKINETQYIIAIADVSGKGVPASLLMSNVQASLLALSTEVSDFSKLVYKVNNIIYANTDSEKFITFFGGVLDIEKRTFTYVNAGHNPPYWRKTDGTLHTLDKGGLLLGMLPDMPYEQETITLSPGEGIVMFTDGVTEAMNEKLDQYDESRLEALIKTHPKITAKECTEKIAAEVKTFAGAAPQSDDITVVILHAI